VGSTVELVFVFPFLELLFLLFTLLDLLLLLLPLPKLTPPGRWVTMGEGLAFLAGKELEGG